MTVYHGSPYLFKVPYCGYWNMMSGSNLGFHCSTTYEGAKEYTTNCEIGYVYEYELNTRGFLPTTLGKRELLEIYMAIVKIGKANYPEKFSAQTWTPQGVAELVDCMFKRNDDKKLYFNRALTDIARFLCNPALVINGVVACGYNYSIISAACEYEEERCDVSVFDSKDLRLKRVTQIHTLAGGLEIDITEGLKNLVV